MQYPIQSPPEGYVYREVPYAVKCPICNGLGTTYTVSAFGETCPECDGAGKVTAMSWETVPAGVAAAKVGRDRSFFNGCAATLAVLMVGGLIGLVVFLVVQIVQH